MKGKILLLMGLCIGFVTNAQTTAKKVFIGAPFDVLPTIGHLARLDMIDYFESGISKPTASLLDDEALINELTDSHINLTVSESSSIDLYVQPIDNDTLILSIETYNLPAKDSRIKLFDKNWNLIQSLDCGTLEDWITQEASKEKKLNDTMNIINFMTAEATFDEGTGKLSFVPTLDAIVSETELNKVIGSIKPSRKLSVTRKGFKNIDRK